MRPALSAICRKPDLPDRFPRSIGPQARNPDRCARALASASRKLIPMRRCLRCCTITRDRAISSAAISGTCAPPDVVLATPPRKPPAGRKPPPWKPPPPPPCARIQAYTGLANTTHGGLLLQFRHAARVSRKGTRSRCIADAFRPTRRPSKMHVMTRDRSQAAQPSDDIPNYKMRISQKRDSSFAN